MSGEPENARLWADADVWVSFDLDEPDPADVDTPFGGTWELVGLLDGEEGFIETREWEKNDHYAWGSILFRTSRRNYKETWSFTAFEWNDTTLRLYRPGSTDTVWGTPRPERIKIAFETREGDTVHRVISIHEVEAEVDGDVTRSEPDPTAVTFVATIYPNADGELWTVQDSALVGS